LPHLKTLKIDCLAAESVVLLLTALEACGAQLDRLCIPEFGKSYHMFKQRTAIAAIRDRMIKRGVPAENIVLDL